MRTLVTLILAALLASCASSGGNVPRDSKVASISLVGSKLDLRTVGTTVFSNDSRLIDVSEWSVDDHVENTASNRLGSAGYRLVKSSPESRSRVGTLSFFNFTGTYSFSGGRDALRKEALTTGADYLVIVARAPNAFNDPFFGTNQYITGYGIYQRSFLGQRRSVNYAQLVVLLVDGRTGEVVSSRIESSSAPRSASLWIGAEPPDATILAEMRKVIVPLVDDVVRRALDRIV